MDLNFTLTVSFINCYFYNIKLGSSHMSEKTQRVLLRVAAVICLLLSLIEWLYYFLEVYQPFISSYFGWNTYLPSAFRMICRIGYPVAYVGIFFYKRWAAVLLILVWLVQLVPSTIYFLSTSGLDSGHYTSLVTFILTGAFLYWCRKLFAGKILRPILFFLLVTFSLHTAFYFFIHADSFV